MLKEQINLTLSRADDPPDGLGITIISTSEVISPGDILKMVHSVWSVVSKWGRWCDDELGEWPTLEECLKSLPKWFQISLKNTPEGDIENWLDDLHDRQWIWWSGAEIGSGIKIDIVTDSLPASYWPLEFVINSAGGEIIYKDIWLNSNQAKNLLIT
jgi:hypothetical protein